MTARNIQNVKIRMVDINAGVKKDMRKHHKEHARVMSLYVILL